mgnify:CR=1 FL=1
MGSSTEEPAAVSAAVSAAASAAVGTVEVRGGDVAGSEVQGTEGAAKVPWAGAVALVVRAARVRVGPRAGWATKVGAARGAVARAVAGGKAA